ncbi:MAG TPA: 2-C-methyl-D-erythritol 4-phosphate cytidylyltransferase [Dehalococcoidia bacterium]|nr:2-C-methyl-D-erythritol 4-phosphate cytidylyltransferase [Dehalococcoidia bacterium]
MVTGAVIVAAGRSTRMGGADKLLMPVAGRAVVAHAVRPFLVHDAIAAVTVVVSRANQEAVAAAVGKHEKLKFVLGGERRRDSVRAGLLTLRGCDYVVVHDGARPLVTAGLIDAALEGARECGAALCAVPVRDTVKRGDASGHVHSTISREGLWLAQTPQAFRLELLLRAHDVVEGDVTDDAAMIEHLGAPVKLVEGSVRNIKVTTPEDVALVEALLTAGRT